VKEVTPILQKVYSQVILCWKSGKLPAFNWRFLQFSFVCILLVCLNDILFDLIIQAPPFSPVLSIPRFDRGAEVHPDPFRTDPAEQIPFANCLRLLEPRRYRSRLQLLCAKHSGNYRSFLNCIIRTADRDRAPRRKQPSAGLRFATLLDK